LCLHCDEIRILLKMILRYIVICLICLVGCNDRLKAQDIYSVTDLPLQISASKGSNAALMIYISGDGGWNEFNQKIVHEFEKQGYGVVTLNSRKYFWDQKSPEAFAGDIEQLSKYYMKEWKKSSVIIVGYSFGADVGIFLPGRLSSELQKKIVKIALISPSASSDFVIRLSDMIGENENVDRKFKVMPEIEKTDLPVFCIFGKDEKLMLKTSLPKKKNLIIYELPGDHRYNDDFKALSKLIGL